MSDILIKFVHLVLDFPKKTEVNLLMSFILKGVKNAIRISERSI